MLVALSEKYGFSLDTPFQDLSEKVKDIIINGTHGETVTVHYVSQYGRGNVHKVAFEGLVNNVERRYNECFSEKMKAEYEQYMRVTPCPACHGARLKPSSLAVTVGEKNIYEASLLPMDSFYDWISSIHLKEMHAKIA